MCAQKGVSDEMDDVTRTPEGDRTEQRSSAAVQQGIGRRMKTVRDYLISSMGEGEDYQIEVKEPFATKIESSDEGTPQGLPVSDDETHLIRVALQFDDLIADVRGNPYRRVAEQLQEIASTLLLHADYLEWIDDPGYDPETGKLVVHGGENAKKN
jgi:hypothetical protein